MNKNKILSSLFDDMSLKVLRNETMANPVLQKRVIR